MKKTRDTGRNLSIALLAAGCSVGLTEPVYAELQAIDDDSLRQFTGQAAIAFDVVETATGTDFTRFTLGVSADIQTNVDTVVLGEYDLMEGAPGADLQASNVSLGHISRDSNKIQIDGNTYAENEIVPFSGVDPYFEIAQDGGELVGFRMGFNQARGTVSGDFDSFSGNIGIKLDDGSGELKDAQLLTNAGLANSSRATHIGLEGETTDCMSENNCTAISNIQTFEVGVDNGDGTVGFTSDYFFSYQKQALDWQSPSGSIVATDVGVHVNIPTAMTINLSELAAGVPRVRTEFIDRSLGLF
ncbi:MAG: hypothetical protein MI864_25295 [Pseudomonadales bacterium]|nr:hypothetical protein [Pseudomonadales bacterium]